MLNPVAVVEWDIKKGCATPRPSSLDSLTIGLLWNGKRGGEERGFGFPSFRFAVVPDVVTAISPERIREEVEEALPQIIDVLTTPPPDEVSAPYLTNLG